jgi:two-component system, chemotaxis family, response regulator Rcp1
MSRPVDILLVEDSDTDVLMMREALLQAALPSCLHVVENGVEALAYLRRQGSYAEVPRPDLILLDLNLPRKDGREVLTEIKTDAELKSIPIVILTSSTAEDDVLRAYRLHANCYVAKPIDFLNFAKVVNSIEEFWFRVATLPAARK